MINKLNKYGQQAFVILPIIVFLIFVPNQVIATASDILGPVDPPKAVSKINTASGGEIGILYLFSRLVRLATITAGIFIIWNFVSAGFTYISSAGNSNAHVVVRDKLSWSIVGIIVIASAYTIIGLLSLFFFNDATFMLNPEIKGPIGP